MIDEPEYGTDEYWENKEQHWAELDRRREKMLKKLDQQHEASRQERITLITKAIEPLIVDLDKCDPAEIATAVYDSIIEAGYILAKVTFSYDYHSGD